MDFAFSKYSGCGNDFILIDDLEEKFPIQNTSLITKLCDRHEGIGADGLVLLQKGGSCDFRMRIFNRDGSEAEMCGNGLRCLMAFIHDLGIGKQACTIQTMQRQLKAQVTPHGIQIQMGNAINYRSKINILIDQKNFLIDYLDTGVPHLILFMDSLEGIDVEKLAPKFRYHQEFAPKGANVNFVKILQPGKISIRTYERGVECETLACGTGAAAAAIASAANYTMQLPITVEFKSGDSVIVDFKHENGQIRDIVQTGPTRKIFHGVIGL